MGVEGKNYVGIKILWTFESDFDCCLSRMLFVGVNEEIRTLWTWKFIWIILTELQVLLRSVVGVEGKNYVGIKILWNFWKRLWLLFWVDCLCVGVKEEIRKLWTWKFMWIILTDSAINLKMYCRSWNAEIMLDSIFCGTFESDFDCCFE